MRKTQIRRILYKKVYGQDHRLADNRVKERIRNVHRKYVKERNQLSRTEEGLLLKDLHVGSSEHAARSQLLSRMPYFDIWHSIVLDRVKCRPTEVYTMSHYDVPQRGESEVSEQGCHGRNIPPLDSSQVGGTFDPELPNVLIAPTLPLASVGARPRSEASTIALQRQDDAGLYSAGP